MIGFVVEDDTLHFHITSTILDGKLPICGTSIQLQYY